MDWAISSSLLVVCVTIALVHQTSITDNLQLLPTQASVRMHSASQDLGFADVAVAPIIAHALVLLDTDRCYRLQIPL
jgi:hypothetical protein